MKKDNKATGSGVFSQQPEVRLAKMTISRTASKYYLRGEAVKTKILKYLFRLCGFKLCHYTVKNDSGHLYKGLIAIDSEGLEAQRESFKVDFNNVTNSWLNDV